MRIFAPRQRIGINKDNELDLLNEEWAYYTQNNQYPVSLFGHPLVNINKNINLQAVLGYNCNHDCPFCVEKDLKTRVGCSDELYAQTLNEIVGQYHTQGIFPSVSITGGEPLLYLRRLRLVVKVLNDLGVRRFNINTNGSFLARRLDLVQEMRVPSFNISRHSHIPGERATLTGFRKEISDEDLFHVQSVFKNICCLQAVMCKEGLNSLEAIKAYMDHYMAMGFRQFSFRGLSALDETKIYESEINYSQNNWVDIFDVIDNVAKDPDFEFVQQKIGDHYLYEIWRYKGCTLRFTYSNLNLLRTYELEEKRMGKRFSRATILYPNSRVTSGWCDTYVIREN